MTENSKKIRIDFLKNLGVICECESDMNFIKPIPDTQLLKAIIRKGLKNGQTISMLSRRYGVREGSLRAIKDRNDLQT